MVKKIIGFLLIVWTGAISGGAAYADDLHYTNLLVGDRASGMAGAYTAVSDDATGLYYNPAGIAYITGRSMSASVNAYYDNEKTYKNVIGGNGWSRRSSSLLPNYFGVVQPLGKLKVGFSYAVPDSSMEDQSQTFSDLRFSSNVVDPTNTLRITSYVINFNNEKNVYEVGPSVAVELADNLSAGLTLYYYQDKQLQILTQIIKANNGGFETDYTNYHLTEQGIRPILGFMWSPANDVSIGLAVSKIMILDSNAYQQFFTDRQNITFANDTTCDGTPVTNQSSRACFPAQINSSFKREHPTQVGLGVAWFPSQSLLISGDINYFSAIKSQEQNVAAVTNFAVGTEYYLTKNWAVRGGAYTNLANTPQVKSGYILQDEHIDIYGATASISHFTRNTSVTLGGGVNYGSGKAQIISGSDTIQTALSQGWMLFLSSSYSY